MIFFCFFFSSFLHWCRQRVKANQLKHTFSFNLLFVTSSLVLIDWLTDILVRMTELVDSSVAHPETLADWLIMLSWPLYIFTISYLSVCLVGSYLMHIPIFHQIHDKIQDILCSVRHHPWTKVLVRFMNVHGAVSGVLSLLNPRRVRQGRLTSPTLTKSPSFHSYNLRSTSSMNQRRKGSDTLQFYRRKGTDDGNVSEDGMSSLLSPDNSTTGRNASKNMHGGLDSKIIHRFTRWPLKAPRRKKTLILDLDETLIHSTSKGSRASDFMVEVMIDRHPFLYYVYKRPHADYFLRTVSLMFEHCCFMSNSC